MLLFLPFFYKKYSSYILQAERANLELNVKKEENNKEYQRFLDIYNYAMHALATSRITHATFVHIISIFFSRLRNALIKSTESSSKNMKEKSIIELNHVMKEFGHLVKMENLFTSANYTLSPKKLQKPNHQPIQPIQPIPLQNQKPLQTRIAPPQPLQFTTAIRKKKKVNQLKETTCIVNLFHIIVCYQH